MEIPYGFNFNEKWHETEMKSCRSLLFTIYNDSSPDHRPVVSSFKIKPKAIILIIYLLI